MARSPRRSSATWDGSSRTRPPPCSADDDRTTRSGSSTSSASRSMPVARRPTTPSWHRRVPSSPRWAPPSSRASSRPVGSPRSSARRGGDCAERAFHSSGVGTAYLELPDDHWPKDHPRQTWAPYAVGAVGYDVIPHASALRRLYESSALLAFLEDVLDRGTLYRYADPCGALNLAVMADGRRAAVALRPDRLRRLARHPGGGARRQLRRRAQDPQPRRRAL